MDLLLRIESSYYNGFLFLGLISKCENSIWGRSYHNNSIAFGYILENNIIWLRLINKLNKTFFYGKNLH